MRIRSAAIKIASGFVFLGILGCSSQGPVVSAEPADPAAVPDFGTLERAFVRARILEVPVLSPKNFERAWSHFQEARATSQAGYRANALLTSQSELSTAFDAAKLSRQVLSEVLEARSAISRQVEMEAKKNTAMRRTFDRAERAFGELAEMVEDGQVRRALREKSAVVRSYLDCEAFVSPVPSFAESRRALERARLVGAARRFPEDFATTKLTLEAAERFAKEHPGAYNETPRRIREADFYARRLLAKARSPQTSSVAE